MPACDYCDREFDDEESYLDHLGAEHYDDLDRIDRRRVDDRQSSSGVNTTVVVGVGAVVALLVLAGGAYAVLSGGGGGNGANAASGGDGFTVEQQPFNLRGQHVHGTIEVRIGDRSFDFSQSQFQLQDDYFHFEGGQGERWHVHGQGVTLQYGLATLGIGVTENSVIYEGRQYNRSDSGVSITMTVNGEPVDPATYVLQDGDDVRVVVDLSG